MRDYIRLNSMTPAERENSLKAILSQISSKAYSYFQGTINRLSEESQNLKSQIDIKQRHYEKLLEDQNAEHRQNIQSYIKRIENINKKNLEMGSEYQDLEKEFQELKSVSRIETEDLKSEISELLDQIDRLKQLQNDLEDKRRQEMTRYSNKLSLSEKDLEKSQLEVRSLESQLKDITKRLLEIQENELSDVSKVEMTAFKGQIEQLKSELNFKDQKIISLSKETEELQTALQKSTQQFFSFENEMKTLVEGLKKQLSETQIAILTKSDQLSQAEMKIKGLESSSGTNSTKQIKEIS